MKIALIGFMGTGKTSLGKLLAARLQYDFVDTDQLLETRQKQSIATIFARHGEDYFRQLERELARELAEWDRVVISTGGGFALNPDNLQPLRHDGIIVSLVAPAETIYERVKADSERPLLAGADPLGRIRDLLRQRAAIYRGADVVIDTSEKSPEELADELVRRLETERTGQ